MDGTIYRVFGVGCVRYCSFSWSKWCLRHMYVHVWACSADASITMSCTPVLVYSQLCVAGGICKLWIQLIHCGAVGSNRLYHAKPYFQRRRQGCILRIPHGWYFPGCNILLLQAVRMQYLVTVSNSGCNISLLQAIQDAISRYRKRYKLVVDKEWCSDAQVLEK